MENCGKMKFGENILKISEYFEEKKKKKNKNVRLDRIEWPSLHYA